MQTEHVQVFNIYLLPLVLHVHLILIHIYNFHFILHYKIINLIIRFDKNIFKLWRFFPVVCFTFCLSIQVQQIVIQPALHCTLYCSYVLLLRTRARLLSNGTASATGRRGGVIAESTRAFTQKYIYNPELIKFDKTEIKPTH